MVTYVVLVIFFLRIFLCCTLGVHVVRGFAMLSWSFSGCVFWLLLAGEGGAGGHRFCLAEAFVVWVISLGCGLAGFQIRLLVSDDLLWLLLVYCLVDWLGGVFA